VQVIENMVARDGVEPPTPAFSAALFRSNHIFNQQLNPSEWPIYCDHSVTSADVRLSVGEEFRKSNEHLCGAPPRQPKRVEAEPILSQYM